MKKLLLILVIVSINCFAQNEEQIDYSLVNEYEIGGITIIGANTLNSSSIVSISGLIVGNRIKVPGNEISQAIRNLWDQNLFSDVNIVIDKIIDDIIFLKIIIVEESRISKFKFKGKISKGDITSLKEELQLMRGKALSQNLISKSINRIRNFYIDKGFLNVEVSHKILNDTTTTNSKDLIFTINKGKKIKIKDILIKGRKKIANTKKSILNKKDTTYAISDRKIKKSMKETKVKNFWRIFKISKFTKQTYEEDKLNLISKYNEKGYRDARIINDTIYKNQDNTITIEIEIAEGDPYTFGEISFVGNKLHSNEKLLNRLGIKEGDIFDQTTLNSRLFGNQENSDVSSLYLDDGYLFFNATPIEIGINNDRSIDLEIRIYEGKQARVNKVLIKGNTKTNDHVIMREIRTRPGDLFKRSDIMRSQRELSQMQYFDPEAFDVKVDPDPVKNEVDITYILAEKSSDQIQLQGGWGGNRVMGSLGLTFNNFSTRNLFNKSAWSPLPTGDGQRLSITASTMGWSYQSYNMSFTEPWLGGKKPTSLTTSIYKSIRNYAPPESDRQAMEITGLTIGIGKRLKFPDDYFGIYNGINLQQYKIINTNSFFSFTDGSSNNINYNIKLSRNSVDQLIYPRRGSNFSLSLKLTPPYSLFDGIDDYKNLTDKEKYEWVEYYKWNFKSSWYSSFTNKLVFTTKTEFGLLGSYNKSLGISPFERFYVGGDGLSGMGYVFDGRELISLRGYNNNSVSSPYGSSLYTKYTTELRYAISLNPGSTVYVLTFAEAGNAWDDAKGFDPFSVKRSAGFGVRIMLPMVGMMGLDYGWGLDEVVNPNANGGQFHFSIGQQF